MTTRAPKRSRRVNRGGRPRLNRERRFINPALELDVLQRLREQADAVGVALAPYLELLLARAHGWSGPYLPDLDVLPTPVTARQLRERAQQLEPDDCTPSNGPTARKGVNVDRELADKIEARCAELDATYAAYLRAIFREAVGYPTHPKAAQLGMEIDFARGEARLPKAG